MNKIFEIILIITVLVSCKNVKSENTQTPSKTEFQEIITDNYELSKPTENIKAVLILFPGFANKAIDTKREFKIIEITKHNNIAVIYMNYNQKLWLVKDEKLKLAEQLQKILLKNELPITDVYIGGDSSGGNISFLISSFLNENKNFNFKPKGVFMVDSPIDLAALYKSSEKNLERNFSEVSVTESTWIIETLDKRLGNPYNNISKYQEYATYTSETNNIDNLKGLKNTKIRLYTEPDTLWWKENRMTDYDQLNSYYIKRLSKDLKESGFNQVEYIPTENKGYRENGDRHPHSWSIVEKEDLMKWITQ